MMVLFNVTTHFSTAEFVSLKLPAMVPTALTHHIGNI